MVGPTRRSVSLKPFNQIFVCGLGRRIVHRRFSPADRSITIAKYMIHPIAVSAPYRLRLNRTSRMPPMVLLPGDPKSLASILHAPIKEGESVWKRLGVEL
jgi:hypothetical protein